MLSEDLKALLSEISKTPWDSTLWGVRRADTKYIVQETDLTYGVTPDYQLMALAPELAEEVVKHREEVAALKERIGFCFGSCNNINRGL